MSTVVVSIVVVAVVVVTSDSFFFISLTFDLKKRNTEKKLAEFFSLKRETLTQVRKMTFVVEQLPMSRKAIPVPVSASEVK